MNRFTKTSVRNNTQTTHIQYNRLVLQFMYAKKNTLQFTSCNCSFLFSKYDNLK